MNRSTIPPFPPTLTLQFKQHLCYPCLLLFQGCGRAWEVWSHDSSLLQICVSQSYNPFQQGCNFRFFLDSLLGSKSCYQDWFIYCFKLLKSVICNETKKMFMTHDQTTNLQLWTVIVSKKDCNSILNFLYPLIQPAPSCGDTWPLYWLYRYVCRYVILFCIFFKPFYREHSTLII